MARPAHIKHRIGEIIDTKPTYKNWPAICRIENQWLRLLVATTNDTYVLAGLQRGFPDYFTAEQTSLCVPVSVIRETAYRLRLEEFKGDACAPQAATDDVETFWEAAIMHYQILILFRWDEDEDGEPIPVNLKRQLVGKSGQAGLPVTYRGLDCVVIGILGDEKKRANMTLDTNLTCLILVSAQHIDLEANQILEREWIAKKEGGEILWPQRKA